MASRGGLGHQIHPYASSFANAEIISDMPTNNKYETLSIATNANQFISPPTAHAN